MRFGTGVTKEDALHVLNKKDFLYGNAVDVLSKYIINLDKKVKYDRKRHIKNIVMSTRL